MEWITMVECSCPIYHVSYKEPLPLNALEFEGCFQKSRLPPGTTLAGEREDLSRYRKRRGFCR